MQSSDNFITIEMFNSGIQEIKSEMQEMKKEMKQEIKDTRNELLTEIRLNQNDVAHLQTSIYWGFAIIGVVIGIVGLVVAILAIMPQFRREKPVTQNAPSESKVQEMIDIAINRALRTVAG